MYHPIKWRKLSVGIWEVDDATVGLMKTGKWFCDTCKSEVFRISKTKHKPWCCKHVRWVLRKEKNIESLMKEAKELV